MSIDRAALAGKRNLTEFERAYLLDRNMLDHPGLGEDAASTFLDTGYQGTGTDAGTSSATAPDEEAEVETWDSLSYQELQSEAKARGLSTGGNKADIISRIEKYDAENPAAE